MKRQTVTSSILFLTIAEIIFNFSGYIIHAFLGRILGPSDYGRYAVVVTLTTMIIMLLGNGIPTAMSKFVSGFFETKPEMILVVKRKAAYLQFILITIVTAVFFLCAPLIAHLLKDPTLTSLFRLSSLIIPSFAAASFYLYFYIGIHRFNLQAILKIIRSIARVAFVIGLAYFFGLKGSIIAYILAPASVFLTAAVIDATKINKLFKTTKSAHFDWRQLANYAWPVTLFMIFYEILISLDLYFVKALLANDHLTGIYNAALTIARIPYYLFYALTLAILPSVSRTTSQNNNRETTRIISQTFRFMLMILVPLVIIMVVYAQPLTHLFFGKKFSEAVLPIQILAPGMGFLTIFYVMCYALNGAGKVKLPMYMSFFGMVTNAVLNYMLIKKYGITGSAIATTLTSIFVAIFVFILTRRIFKLIFSLSTTIKIVISGITIIILSRFLIPEDWIFLIWSLVMLGTFILCLILFKEISKDDFKLFQKIISKRPGDSQNLP